MTEETTFTGKPEPESRVMGVSVRGWIALLLTSTVCAMNLAALWPTLHGVSQFVLKIEEPLYSGWLLALGFYFGQKKP